MYLTLEMLDYKGGQIICHFLKIFITYPLSVLGELGRYICQV